MYNFVDTIEHTSEAVLPAEAMSFNGEYIENVIDGYRTLYVKGRDTLSPEIELGEVGVRDGAYLKNKRFPARIITIGYQLLAETNTAFRERFNALNALLNTEDAELIFADEDDKYFTGTVQGFSDVPEGRNSITSEFEIICADPFKYSTTEYEVTPTLDSGATFSVNYKGTYPAYPVLETDFYASDEEDNADGECGYVAFINQKGKVLQFGSPEEVDTIAETVKEITTETSTTYGKMTQAKQLLTEQFNAVGNWNNAGYMTVDTYVRAGSLKCALFPTTGSTDKAIQANSYGPDSSPQFHGPTACKSIGNPPAVSGASNPTRSADFTFKFKARICCSNDSATAKKQAGTLQAFVLDASDGYICGCQIWKNSGTDKGKVRVYVRGHSYVKTWENVDLSFYNKYFGYRKGNGADPNLYVTIKKTGGKFEFNVAGFTYTYTDNALANRVAGKISYYFGRWGNKPAFDRLGVYSCSFTDNAVQYTVPTTTTTENIEYLTNIIEVVNTFGTNDVLIADCGAATVRLQSVSSAEVDKALGNERPDLGALGNDWEEFTLEKGENAITTMYSDWVADEYKPTFKLRYRERFL